MNKALLYSPVSVETIFGSKNPEQIHEKKNPSQVAMHILHKVLYHFCGGFMCKTIWFGLGVLGVVFLGTGKFEGRLNAGSSKN